jgi:hypothetical protein
MEASNSGRYAPRTLRRRRTCVRMVHRIGLVGERSGLEVVEPLAERAQGGDDRRAGIGAADLRCRLLVSHGSARVVP